MDNDWMGLFLAALIGFSLGWAWCSYWAARMLDAERRRLKGIRLADYITEVEPEDTPLMRELRRLQEQERFNRERG